MKTEMGWKQILFMVLLLAVLFLVYSPSLRFQRFVYDDNKMVPQHVVVKGPWSFRKIMTTDFWGENKKKTIGSYRPVVVMAFWLEHKLWGEWRAGYAWTQILWKFLICVLLLLLCLQWKLSHSASWLAVFLYAIHPSHTDNIASIAGRSDLLSLFFFLIALLMHHSYRENRAQEQNSSNWKKTLPIFVAMSFFLGLCSKEFVVVFWGLVVALDWISCFPKSTGASKKNFRSLIPSLPWGSYGLYSIGLLAYIFLRYQALGSFVQLPHGKVDNPLIVESIWIRLLNVPAILWKYSTLLFFTHSLSPDRSFDSIPVIRSFFSLSFWGGIAILCFLLWLLWSANRVTKSVVLLGCALYFPLSNLVILGAAAVWDRWLLFPSIAFCMGFSVLFFSWIREFSRWKRLSWFALAGLCLVWAGTTFDYTNHWRSERTLFQYAVERSPRSIKARYIYGQELMRANQFFMAIPQFLAMLEVKPDSDLGWLALSQAYERTLQRKKAEKALHQLIRILGKETPFGEMQLLMFWRRTGRIQEAQQLHQRLSKKFPALLPSMPKK